MPPSIVVVDDKHVPLYRIVWVADLPHFCGDPECLREGQYEVRLDVDDSVWTGLHGRDAVLAALSQWCGDEHDDDEAADEDRQW